MKTPTTTNEISENVWRTNEHICLITPQIHKLFYPEPPKEKVISAEEILKDLDKFKIL